MDSKESVKIQWISERNEDIIYKTISNIRSNLLGLYFSEFGDEFNNVIPQNHNNDNIEFKNFIIKNVMGYDYSNLSVEGTIAMTYNEDQFFVIPPDLIKYIQDNIRDSLKFNVYETNFPHSIEELYLGKDLYDILIKRGFPSQSAYMICGMLYAKSKWDPNYFDPTEVGKNNWTTRKEGLLAINKWPQKLNIINKLGLNKYASFEINPNNVKSIPTNESKYKTGKYGLLYMLDLSTWIEILYLFINESEKNPSDEKTLLEYLMYSQRPVESDDPKDDDHLLLYAGYLLPEAYDYSKSFESVEEKVQKETETELLNGKYKEEITNGFILSLLIAKLLSQFCCCVPVDDLSLADIFPNYGHLSMMNLENSFDSKTYKGKSLPIIAEKPNAKGITIINHTENMYRRKSPIQYIILHYSASTTSGKNNSMVTVKTLDTRGFSSDFAVDDDNILQFAEDITKWRSTAVQAWSASGTPAGKGANNDNSISIEMSSTLEPGGKWVPNDPHFKFTSSVLSNTRYLCKLLVKEFNIPKEHIIRHYDIMGKACPGIIGWNLAKGSNNENKYREFVDSVFDGEEVDIPETLNNTIPTEEKENYVLKQTGSKETSSYDKMMWENFTTKLFS